MLISYPFFLSVPPTSEQVHARTARFEQVWRSRRRDGRKEGDDDDDPMRELFHLYDVVHVDVEIENAAKTERRKQAKRSEIASRFFWRRVWELSAVLVSSGNSSRPSSCIAISGFLSYRPVY